LGLFFNTDDAMVGVGSVTTQQALTVFAQVPNVEICIFERSIAVHITAVSLSLSIKH